MINYFRILLFALFLFCTEFLAAQHQNILISEANEPNEPAIIIDPNNTNRMVAATNLSNYYTSADGGLTWTENVATSTYGVWGDPVVSVDANGNFYYFHLSHHRGGNWIDRIVCQKSTDGGLTWSDGTFTGLNGTKAQDKHWVAMDHKKNAMYLTWTQFDAYGSHAPEDSTIIRFSKSMDGGETWSDAIRISELAGNCVDDDSTVEGAVPCIGPNGEIYVSWAGPAGIVFDKSLDGGETWLKNDIPVDPMPGGWNYIIPGIQRSNGMPITTCDISGGKNHGTIYINWSDQRNGIEDTDVWLKKSTDGGRSWSELIRVNDDPAGKQQFFTWMAIDQTSGALYFVFYDRRNYKDENTDVFMAVSYDGGETFINFKISESPFFPVDGIFFGDYTNISVHDNVIRPIWTRLDEGELSIWTAIVQPHLITDVLKTEIADPGQHSLSQNFPNPFNKETFISFKLHQSAKVTLKIIAITGKRHVVIFSNKHFEMGKHIESFDAKKYKLASGNYFYVVEADGQLMSKKMIVIK
ncbi:MAG: T9SS C-terminal target domain-containing protein [Calditrichaeota bacterium]|nr:MAG: T9SS C-terminal target domain-containing protein [Calditrichota bacterium]